MAVLAALTGVASPRAALALTPDEVLVVYRAASTDARPILDRYRRLRALPAGNTLGLHVDAVETIDRAVFEKAVMAPLRAELSRPERAGIRCLLVLRGMPLRVGAAVIEGADAKRTRSTIASFDSEIALVCAPPASTEGWASNPLFRPGAPAPTAAEAASAGATGARGLMVARLDGPSLQATIGLIDGAEAGEKGIQGAFCFDARGLQGTDSYGAYDERIRLAARLAEQSGFAVRLDDRPELFAPGSCTDTALYIGWYSLANYVDAFTFRPGAVGYHIASSEAESLSRGNYWVPRMIADGIAATLGPVDEPYLSSFPDPVGFVARLLMDRTLAEAYWETVPHGSWMQVLVGDPLYRPKFLRAR